MSVQDDIKKGERFAFGENWRSFLSVIDDTRIGEAEKSLREFFGIDNLTGKRFLDIGSGSGLFSLAARRLGASVHSFDYDPQAVECGKELRRRYFPDDPQWRVEQGSVLDAAFLRSLGQYDCCYSWGVLHHTGHLWQAVYNAQRMVAPGGQLFIAIYNDERLVSALWTVIKRTYCSGWLGRAVLTPVFYSLFFTAGLLIDCVHFRSPARRYREHRKYRGMSLVHDWKDWLGGYPFEVATPERMIAYVENFGFALAMFKPTGHGFGNNQFVFRKAEGDGAAR